MDALYSAQPGAVLRKSVWDIGEFARAINSLAGIATCLQYEADYEKDGSKVPAALREKVAELCGIFLASAAEEMSEMLAAMPSGVTITTDPTDDPEVAIAVGKAITALEPKKLEKIGARNSKADMGRLQKIHDYLVELGVACAADTTEKLAKVTAEKSNLEKVISDALPQIEQMKKDIEKLKSEPMPAPPRMSVVEKGADVSGVAHPSAASIDEQLSKMTPDELAKLAIRVSQQKPINIHAAPASR